MKKKWAIKKIILSGIERASAKKEQMGVHKAEKPFFIPPFISKLFTIRKTRSMKRPAKPEIPLKSIGAQKKVEAQLATPMM